MSKSLTARFWLSMTWLQGSRYLGEHGFARRGRRQGEHRQGSGTQPGMGDRAGPQCLQLWVRSCSCPKPTGTAGSDAQGHVPDVAAPRCWAAAGQPLASATQGSYLSTSWSMTSSQLRLSSVLKRLKDTMQSWGQVGGEGAAVGQDNSALGGQQFRELWGSVGEAQHLSPGSCC